MASILFLFFCMLSGSSFFHSVQGQRLRNVTVDDSHESIHYSGNWILSQYIDLDEGGYHKLTQDPTAEAVFTFTGVAIYFMSPLWSYEVTTQLQVDSQPPVTVNLRDYNSPRTVGGWETVGSSVVWGVDSLENKQHELRIRVASGDEWAIVDALIFTTVEAQDQAPFPPTTSTESPSSTTLETSIPTSSSAPTTTASAVPSATETAQDVSPMGSHSTVIIVIGATLGSLLLLGLIVLGCYLRHRRRRGDHEQALTYPKASSYKFPSNIYTRPTTISTPSRTASTNSLSLRANETTSSTVIVPPLNPPSAQVLEMRDIPRGPSLDLPPPDYYDNSGQRISLYHNSHASRWSSRLSSQMSNNSLSQHPIPVPPIPVHLQFQPSLPIAQLLQSDYSKPPMPSYQ